MTTPNEDSLYKRVEDQEWRKQVDRTNAMLTTSVNVLQDQMRELKKQQRENDVTLRGERGKAGLVSEYERLDDKTTKLYAVIFQDATGRKGILHDIDFLMGRKKDREEGSSHRWTFVQGVVLALVSAITAITVALLAIEPVRKSVGQYIESRFSPEKPKKKPAVRQSRPRRARKVVPMSPVIEPEMTSGNSPAEEVSQ